MSGRISQNISDLASLLPVGPEMAYQMTARLISGQTDAVVISPYQKPLLRIIPLAVDNMDGDVLIVIGDDEVYSNFLAPASGKLKNTKQGVLCYRSASQIRHGKAIPKTIDHLILLHPELYVVGKRRSESENVVVAEDRSGPFRELITRSGHLIVLMHPVDSPISELVLPLFPDPASARVYTLSKGTGLPPMSVAELSARIQQNGIMI